VLFKTGLQDAVTVSAGPDRTLSFGMAGTGADNASLLAEPVRGALGSSPRRTAVKLSSGAQAYRYAGTAAGDARLLVFAAPSTRGVATVVCKGPAEVPGFASDCDAVANSLTLRSGDWLGVPPDPSYGSQIDATIRRLNAQRRRTRRDLARAHTGGAQARAARSLARAYAAAAESLKRQAAPLGNGAVHASIRTAALRASAAHERAAAAAAGGQRRRYDRAVKLARRTDQELERAIAALGSLGYRVSS